MSTQFLWPVELPCVCVWFCVCACGQASAELKYCTALCVRLIPLDKVILRK